MRGSKEKCKAGCGSQVDISKAGISNALCDSFLRILVAHHSAGDLGRVENLRPVKSGLADGGGAFDFILVDLGAVDLEEWV
jgi:hypothetical protein